MVNKLSLGRSLAGIAALAALGSGLAMMLNPHGLLSGLALTPEGSVGYSSLRGLIGGSQVAVGLVCIFAALRARADAVLVGALYFGAVLCGRLLGLAVDGADPFAVRASVFAGFFLLICLGSSRLLQRARQSPHAA